MTQVTQVTQVTQIGQIASACPLLNVRTDQQAVQSWIRARAGSTATVKVYWREAHRLPLWLRYERHGATLTQMSVADCTAFMAFLQNIPPRWISRVRASPGTPGWTPFRGQLSHASCRRSIAIIASMFAWLQSAQYLTANPWILINQATGDDSGNRMLDTKALNEAAMLEVLRFVDSRAPSPSRARIRFILPLVEAVGLRSAELLPTTLGDLRMETEGWVIRVRGKRLKTEWWPCQARRSPRCRRTCWRTAWARSRKCRLLHPLLTSSPDLMLSVGYQALYRHVKGWLARRCRPLAYRPTCGSAWPGGKKH